MKIKTKGPEFFSTNLVIELTTKTNDLRATVLNFVDKLSTNLVQKFGDEYAVYGSAIIQHKTNKIGKQEITLLIGFHTDCFFSFQKRNTDNVKHMMYCLKKSVNESEGIISLNHLNKKHFFDFRDIYKYKDFIHNSSNFLQGDIKGIDTQKGDKFIIVPFERFTTRPYNLPFFHFEQMEKNGSVWVSKVEKPIDTREDTSCDEICYFDNIEYIISEENVKKVNDIRKKELDYLEERLTEIDY